MIDTPQFDVIETLELARIALIARFNPYRNEVIFLGSWIIKMR